MLSVIRKVPQQDHAGEVPVDHVPTPTRRKVIFRVEEYKPIGDRPSQDDLSAVAEHAQGEAVAVTLPDFPDVATGIREEVSAVA